ncbi:MAG: choline kinase [Halobacteriovoraceae bacterium]|nr:choline kinase [Halobacteriovoraceae bacterium]|tara:strand:+ start:5591 stop:6526 length:936 start_codon:yes stop_codon:yes gene_type:complete
MNLKELLPRIIKKHNLGNYLENYHIIQELWSGYGTLARVKTDTQQFIIKYICFPETVDHPKGHNSLFGHNRKVKSYEVEANFYESYTKHRSLAYTPKFIAQVRDETNYLILEDLQYLGFKPKSEITSDEIKLCIEWLAHFHFIYLDQSPSDLWETGTYWHLETRPKEFEIMPEGPLKKYAHIVDQKLNSSKFQTLLHGDAKLANFLFSEDKVSAVDFQYCGKGVGVKDLAYFCSSVFNEAELFKTETEILNYYFSELERLGANETHINSWRTLYPYAWFDFYRFLAGWSPGHCKINEYIKVQMNKVIDEIK